MHKEREAWEISMSHVMHQWIPVLNEASRQKRVFKEYKCSSSSFWKKVENKRLWHCLWEIWTPIIRVSELFVENSSWQSLENSVTCTPKMNGYSINLMDILLIDGYYIMFFWFLLLVRNQHIRICSGNKYN